MRYYDLKIQDSSQLYVEVYRASVLYNGQIMTCNIFTAMDHMAKKLPK
jgi:hypothetical protein